MADTSKQPADVKGDFNNLLKSLRTFFTKLVDLQDGIDREGTIMWIKHNKRMKGANSWLLMCSIGIASLGLDLDSPAIIIGAMLISPLMSPILGIGLAIGTNDKSTLIISLQHFCVSIGIALVTSFIYFWINPLGQETATKEIIDRTEPTLLAGFVAIFGGIAGIISASRKDQSNAIPGVAIATALMPPLCVAGYGLARAEMNIFLNAFYLFFLNSFFIAVSTFLLIRYMKFPFKAYPNAKESRKTSWLIGIVTIVLIIPSVLILNQVYHKKQHEQLVSKFIGTHFGDDKNPQSLGYSFYESDSSRVLAIKLLGKQINEKQIAEYEKLLANSGVKNTKIFPLQDEVVDLQLFEKLQKEISGYQKIVNQLELSNTEKKQTERRIEFLQNRLDSIRQDTLPIVTMNRDVTALLDHIHHLSYGHIYGSVNDSISRNTMIYVHWKDRAPKSKRLVEKEKLSTYLKTKFPRNKIILRDAE